MSLPLSSESAGSENDNPDDIFVRIKERVVSWPLITPNQNRAQIENIRSTIWLPEYANDIFNSLKEDELKRYKVLFHSKQLEYRPGILRLLRGVTVNYKLNRCTLHLAIYLFDCFCDLYNIRVDKLNLTALICLRIAAQLEETVVPKYVDLNRHVRFVYQWEEFKGAERKILFALEFGLLRPTTAHFVQHLSGSFLTLYDYHFYKTSVYGIENAGYESYEQMLNKQTMFLLELADLTLNYHNLCNVRPSILAASCIAVARVQTGLQPSWTPYLERLTSYNEDDLKPYIPIIQKLYKENIQHQQLLKTGQLQEQMQNAPSSIRTLCYWSSPDSGFCDVNIIKVVSEPCNDFNLPINSAIQSSDIIPNDRAVKRTHCVMVKDGETDENDAHGTSTSTDNVAVSPKRLKIL